MTRLFNRLRRVLSNCAAHLPGGHRISMLIMPPKDRQSVDIVAQGLIRRLNEGQEFGKFLVTHAIDYPYLSRYHTRLKTEQIAGFPLFFGDFATVVKELSTPRRAEQTFALLVNDDRAAEAVITVLSVSLLIASSILENWGLLDPHRCPAEHDTIPVEDTKSLRFQVCRQLSDRLRSRLPGRWQANEVDAAMGVFFDPDKFLAMSGASTPEIQ